MSAIEALQIDLDKQKGYAGKHVAIAEDKIVASDDTAKEAFKKARDLFLGKKTEEIGLLYIPREEMLIL
jgi:hypothetical protein